MTAQDELAESVAREHAGVVLENLDLARSRAAGGPDPAAQRVRHRPGPAGVTTTRWTTARVQSVRNLVPGVREVVLGYDHAVSAPVGSHVDLLVHVRGVDSVRLAQDGGGGSRYVHGLQAGDRVRVTDPRPNFPLDHGKPGYVLVAGGIGITALSAMFRLLATRGAPVRLVHAGRERAGMPLLAALLAELPALVEAVVGAEGGRVDADALVAEVPAWHQLYVRGPLGLLEDLRGACARSCRWARRSWTPSPTSARLPERRPARCRTHPVHLRDPRGGHRGPAGPGRAGRLDLP